MKFAFATAAAMLVAAPASAGYFINYEKPGVQETTAGFTVVGVERFEDRTVGLPADFSTDFGTDGKIVATYKGGRIDKANVFGSAGGWATTS
jgi:hypothetical protein